MGRMGQYVCSITKLHRTFICTHKNKSNALYYVRNYSIMQVQAEQAKWSDVPAWKRAVLEKKEAEKYVLSFQ